MATSPLFGWEEPDDVDLVKDGAAAIRTLGNAIDTSMGDLLGGTTGQVLSKASNTNMDFTWVAQDDSNAIQNAIVDAKGDLIAASAADTPARLAVGTNGQVLTADSTASTGLAWSASGGMTQLATGTLSGTAVTLSSISQSYKHLKLDIFGANPNVQDFWAIRFNGLTAGSYCSSNYAHAGATVYNYGSDSDNAWFIRFDAAGNYYFTNGYNHLSLDLFDYTSTTPIPLAKSSFSGQLASGTYASQQGVHSYKASSAAITSLTIRTNGGATLSGGTYILWGVN
jgi:hypothetical protein